MLCNMKPAAIGARRASGFVDEQQVSGPEDNPSQVLQQAIRADLIGSDTCAALGLTINSSSPVLALCASMRRVRSEFTTVSSVPALSSAKMGSFLPSMPKAIASASSTL